MGVEMIKETETEIRIIAGVMATAGFPEFSRMLKPLLKSDTITNDEYLMIKRERENFFAFIDVLTQADEARLRREWYDQTVNRLLDLMSEDIDFIIVKCFVRSIILERGSEF